MKYRIIFDDDIEFNEYEAINNLDSRINMTRLVNPLRESCKYLPACLKAHQS